MIDWMEKIFTHLSEVSIITYGLSLLLGVLGSLLASSCTLPLILLIVGQIAGQENIGKRKILLIPILFMVGSILSFSILGAVAAFTGSTLKPYLQHRWNYLIAVFSLVLGLSMLVKISLPKLNFRFLHNKGNLGYLLSGVLIGGSGACASSCCLPVLPMLLAYIATSGRIVHGSLLLTTYAIGQSIPLFAVALFASTTTSLLAKVSNLSSCIRQISGVLLILVGIYFLWRA